MELEPRIRRYEFDHLMETSGRALMQARPLEVYEILLPELRKVIDLEQKKSSFYLIRPSIEATEDRGFRTSTDSLIDAVRDALVSLADAGHPSVSAVLKGLLCEEHPLLRRLALFMLAERPAYIAEVPPELLLPSPIDLLDTRHEQMRLLNQRFLDLPSSVQASVHEAIAKSLSYERPNEMQESDLLELRLAWRLVHVLPEEALTLDERNAKKRLVERFGTLEDPLSVVRFSGVFAVQPPAGADELSRIASEKGIKGLLGVLRNPEPHFKRDWMHDYELLWDVLSTLITEKPHEYLAMAEDLQVADFPNAWRYFRSYEDLAKQGVVFDWDPLLSAIARLLNEHDAKDIYWTAGHFLSEAASNSANPLNNDQLGRVVEVARMILNETSKPLGSIEDIEGDLLTHQLNAPAGTASEALMNVLFKTTLDASDQDERRNPFPERIRFDSTLSEILESGVKDGWGGVELRCAIGQHLRTIIWADRGWLDQRVEMLLARFDESDGAPAQPTPELIGAWRAFWSGYLRTDRLYEPIMKTLRDRYSVLVADASREEPRILATAFYGHDRNALGHHLMIGWLRGYEGFGRDELFGEFVAKVPDDARAHVVRSLESVLHEAKESSDESWRDRIPRELDDFWDWRCNQLRPTLMPDDTSKELSAFAYWLEETAKEPDEVQSRLQLMARHMEPGSELEKLTDYLLKYSEAEPLTTVSIMRDVANRFIRDDQAIWWVGRYPQLFERVWTNEDDPSIRALLNQIASDLLEHRQIDLRGVIRP